VELDRINSGNHNLIKAAKGCTAANIVLPHEQAILAVTDEEIQ